MANPKEVATEYLYSVMRHELTITLERELWGDEFIKVEACEGWSGEDTRSVRVPAREFFDAVRRLELQRK